MKEALEPRSSRSSSTLGEMDVRYLRVRPESMRMIYTPHQPTDEADTDAVEADR